MSSSNKTTTIKPAIASSKMGLEMILVCGKDFFGAFLVVVLLWLTLLLATVFRAVAAAKFGFKVLNG